ncbi:hypothetical protein [Paracoccus seriniphilus]|uniref:hypothetical protein n=1 Tax=Paracoccus seriniphilus TaxID=184748 RepID=UPI003562F9F7
MRGSFRCSDPLTMMCRVVDVARRMDLGFTRLEFQQQGNQGFALDFTLDDDNAQRVNTFVQRVGLYIDLAEETVDV